MSMEPDVLKIASQKDVEQYELQNGGVVNHNNVDTKNKGKAIQIESPYNQEFAGSASDCYDDAMSVSNSLLDPDSLIYEDDDDYNDEYGYEMEMEEEPDSYSMYQDLFDSKDLPTGVEVSMEFFPDSADNETANTNGTSKSSRVKTEDKSDGSGSSSKKPTKGTGIHSPFFSSDIPTPIAQPWKALPNKSGGVTPNSAYGLPQLNKGIQSPFVSGSNNLQPQTPDTVMGEAPIPAPAYAPKFNHGVKYNLGSRPVVEDVLQAPVASRPKRNMEDFLGKYLFFKRFDIAEDSSDHYYASKGTATKQHSKEWVRRIQEEWRTLENDLPEMIFVRAYESRMDLLRAVIIGAQGTPYHDGLFFFDIYFPDSYPSVPPNVHYHSGGLRINPNLYNCGKVCLSLLGTWSGSPREKWIANDSTMLQVLVSIQGLILNEKPYFNEPGYERSAGSPQGESASKAYSENTFILSLKTMVYNMRRPPKFFEDFSHGHFFSCAHDVLKACDAYRNGAPVGTKVKVKAAEVKEEVKDEEAKDAVAEKPETCSTKFRKEVSTFVETVLLHEFIVLGVKGLEAEEEEEEKPAEINNVPESSTSTSTRSRSKRDRGSSS